MMGTFITFIEAGRSVSGKTLRWRICTKDNGAELGQIRWYPQWRKYVFYPYHATLYEWVCLREIAAFCEARTNAHKAAP